MEESPLIFFDGVCNLCTGSVQFILKRDRNNVFRFASLQGSVGKAMLEKQGMGSSLIGSIMLVENGKLYTRSTAALRVAKRLSGGWPLLYAFIVVPPFIRDGMYNLVARNRYRWFGRKQECWNPGPQWKERFLN